MKLTRFRDGKMMRPLQPISVLCASIWRPLNDLHLVSDRVSPAEYVRGLRALTLANRTVRLTCVGAALALIGSGTYLLHRGVLTPSGGTYTAAAVALFSAFYMYLMWQVPVTTTRQYFASSPEAAESLTWTLSEAGVEVATPKARTNVTWDGITAATENDEFLFLYRAKATAILVPWRVVSSDEQQQLRQLLHRALGAKAKDLQSNERGA